MHEALACPLGHAISSGYECWICWEYTKAEMEPKRRKRLERHGQYVCSACTHKHRSEKATIACAEKRHRQTCTFVQELDRARRRRDIARLRRKARLSELTPQAINAWYEVWNTSGAISGINEVSIAAKDKLIRAVLELAKTHGWVAGCKYDIRFSLHPYCIYVDTPKGQVSFHSATSYDLPPYPGNWSGVHNSRQILEALFTELMDKLSHPVA
jgi:hypothetical protein